MSEGTDLIVLFEDPPAEVVVSLVDENPDLIVSFQDNTTDVVVLLAPELPAVDFKMEQPAATR